MDSERKGKATHRVKEKVAEFFVEKGECECPEESAHGWPEP